MSKMPAVALHANAPWHRESFDKFMSESLPRLLARRLPLTGYAVRPNGEYECTATVTVNDVEVAYTVLQPDDDGLFCVDGEPFVVVPVASSENLDTAEVQCVGEQIYQYIESRLGTAQGDLPWDESLVRAWLPLDTWVRQIVASSVEQDAERRAWIHQFVTSGVIYNPELWTTGQPLDTTNGISMRTHFRRIVIPNIERVIAPSQFGRVCPFEVPEGPNIGHVFSVALGARIRDGRFEVIDDRPEAALGLTASMVPFLEHSDANRLLMGVNMMRQWTVRPDPEPALVQTGNEPNAPDVWCGRNLLTAFVSWGAETYEDGILVSESGARKLGDDVPAQVGDKISNRHGSKGVIGRILPDDQMPRLPDGTPADLVYNFIGIHARLNFGQLREALMGRIARAEGEPAIVPPFSAPTSDELRERLTKSGLPEDGMDLLTIGKGGPRMEHPSTVGWVYWGRTVYLSGRIVHACTHGRKCNRHGELEYFNLRDAGCFELLNSMFNTCSDDRENSEQFVAAVASGPVEPSAPPTPRFAELLRRLDVAGIRGEFGDDGLRFALGAPSGDTLKLAHPVRHPWLPDHEITEVGIFTKLSEYRPSSDLADQRLDRVHRPLPEFAALAEANVKAGRALLPDAPESLKQKAISDLQSRADAYIAALVTPEQLKLNNRVMFSGRTVLAPGIDLRLDQVGLADEIAWTIFGPLVTREIGDPSQVEQRTEEAARALDEIMARSWVVLDRAPTILPTSMIAFHPVRIPEPVIRLHPLVCFLMNGDFDGDHAAVFLPVTEAAQREAGEKLSVAGHLKRDPDLYGLTFIRQEILWGLAELSLTPEGLREISAVAGVTVGSSGGMVTRDTVASALREIEQRDGIPAMIDAMQRLMELGFRIARESGASISPFIGSSLALPPAPTGEGSEAWSIYAEDVIDILQRSTDYSSRDVGPQLLAVKSGARGNMRQLLRLVGSMGLVKDASDGLVPVRHSLEEGYTPDEVFACIAGAREGLARLANDLTQSGYGVRSAEAPKGFGALARAMRASHPGRILARAASTCERDPLTDLDSRLFVGLGPEGKGTGKRE